MQTNFKQKKTQDILSLDDEASHAGRTNSMPLKMRAYGGKVTILSIDGG